MFGKLQKNCSKVLNNAPSDFVTDGGHQFSTRPTIVSADPEAICGSAAAGDSGCASISAREGSGDGGERARLSFLATCAYSSTLRLFLSGGGPAGGCMRGFFTECWASASLHFEFFGGGGGGSMRGRFAVKPFAASLLAFFAGGGGGGACGASKDMDKRSLSASLALLESTDAGGAPTWTGARRLGGDGARGQSRIRCVGFGGGTGTCAPGHHAVVSLLCQTMLAQKTIQYNAKVGAHVVTKTVQYNEKVGAPAPLV